MKKYIVVIIFVLTLTSNFALASSVKDAEKYYNQGKKELAMEMLKKITGINDKSNKSNHYAWYVLGNYFLDANNYRQAINCFTQAVIIKPNKYDNDIIVILKKTGVKVLSDCSRNSILSSAYLFSKALKFLPKKNQQKFKNEIAELCLNKGENLLKINNLKRADPLFAMAWRYNPNLKVDLCNLVMDYGDVANDYACIKYYVYAKTFCNKNQRCINAGKRLKSIADKLEAKDLFDPRIEKYKKFAGQFIDLPPSVKIYQPGTYILQPLKAGEILDHWIAFPVGQIGRYSLSSKDYEYKLIYNDGSIIKDGKNIKYPKKNYPVFKVLAITSQDGINMKVY